MIMKPTIKKGLELNLTIDSLSYGGKGISRYEGIVIFTNNVLPGQTIKAKIIKKKKSYLEAVPIEIIKESPFKQKEKCNHFYDCGGCKTQDLNYEEQINQKETKHTSKFDVAIYCFVFSCILFCFFLNWFFNFLAVPGLQDSMLVLCRAAQLQKT